MFVEQAKHITHIYKTHSKNHHRRNRLDFVLHNESREMRVTMSALMCINDDQAPRVSGNKLILTRSESSVITIELLFCICSHDGQKVSQQEIGLKKASALIMGGPSSAGCRAAELFSQCGDAPEK